ncbi:hypothetical protein GUJ93_ZPchr0011g27966 [Zizania palustris]|uniref:Uncharacterized protein n=1 Tax=Zizania palustris TaxID=103762 RepID=A0A8J5WIW4_ZIZPA|nr:hypothetical protein GUJ93_ZPchr0011g27966 [Zizania palustris]
MHLLASRATSGGEAEAREGFGDRGFGSGSVASGGKCFDDEGFDNFTSGVTTSSEGGGGGFEQQGASAGGTLVALGQGDDFKLGRQRRDINIGFRRQRRQEEWWRRPPRDGGIGGRASASYGRDVKRRGDGDSLLGMVGVSASWRWSRASFGLLETE